MPSFLDVSLLVPGGALFPVFCLLPCRAAAVGTGYILFLLRLGLYLPCIGVLLGSTPEHDAATGYYLVNVAHLRCRFLVVE